MTPPLSRASASADQRVVARLAAGDLDAAAELYDLYGGHVYGLARRMLRDPRDAEDVVQDVFAQAWRSASRFDPARASVVGWLLMMARARAIDRLRALRARPDVGGDTGVDVVAAAEAPDAVLALDDAARVREALAALPEAQRAAIELAYFEGLTHSEIARALAEPLGTVKTRIRAALQALRARLRT